MVSLTQMIKCYHCPMMLDDYNELQAHRQKFNARKEAIFAIKHAKSSTPSDPGTHQQDLAGKVQP